MSDAISWDVVRLEVLKSCEGAAAQRSRRGGDPEPDGAPGRPDTFCAQRPGLPVGGVPHQSGCACTARPSVDLDCGSRIDPPEAPEVGSGK
jgi:hypothetical protein